MRHVDPSQFDVATLGQVFTPEDTVRQMLSLCQNRREGWRVLEPSCGNGAFLDRIPGCHGVEIDPAHCPPGAHLGDFFAYKPDQKFDTIIGNPPFVRFRDINPDTRSLLDMERFDERTNLYSFFIDRCIDMLRPGGELVFINPRDFLKSTSARPLNEKLMASGTITHIEDLGDQRVFAGFAPNCVIWRFEKGAVTHLTDDGRQAVLSGGHISFLTGKYPHSLSDFFDVKVGGVSGADELYALAGDATSTHQRDFVCSRTYDTGVLRRMIYADDKKGAPAELWAIEVALRARRIKTFTDKNWWHWGRRPPVDPRSRVYVNAKTRRDRPFFCHNSPWFDGSVLGLMIKDPRLEPSALCTALNEVDWDELGFRSGGRFIFGQRSLMNARLPEEFTEFLGAS